MKREEIPDRLEAFHKALVGLLGDGASVAEKLVVETLYERLGLSFEKHESWTVVDYASHAKKIADED